MRVLRAVALLLLAAGCHPVADPPPYTTKVCEGRGVVIDVTSPPRQRWAWMKPDGTTPSLHDPYAWKTSRQPC